MAAHKKIRWFLFIIAGLAIATVVVFKVLFSVPDAEHLIVTDGVKDTQAESRFECQSFARNGRTLDDNGQIDVLVWNLYKQNRENWKPVLSELLKGKQLALLQEVSLTDEFKSWLYQIKWIGQQAKAFETFDVSAGVLNLAPVYPLRICAQLDSEPWLQLPKSALFATYPLSDGSELAVGNLHAINFTVGTDEYQQQVLALVHKLQRHQGPVIFGGDFNTWSDERMQKLSQIMATAHFKEAVFPSGQRSEFMNGHVLDHIYYRDLQLITAEAPTSDASDHNPLLASFTLITAKPSL
ncbi:endonuclease/exonuclease/phosphatase family protein [Vibrio neonatus]|uniref:endonuclease/exonuclease/phosphatase family protein n=1 Tax=Vibrio neonatus TaxID=278860 RepID=UPI0021C31F59|nr:endonuclease/exonuclease/phosphatase family protein [Vibrio neonatus]